MYTDQERRNKTVFVTNDMIVNAEISNNQQKNPGTFISKDYSKVSGFKVNIRK